MGIKLKIDGMPVEVPKGTTIMEAAESVGVRIPHFCHHPKLSSPASCRMCAVQVDGRSDLAMSCKEEACEGMIVRTDTEPVRRSREDVLEFMLANHPIDCPICDRAGECDLQDLYFEYSKRSSRFVEAKVEKPKAKRIGPHVMLDAERCVACGRCVRFFEEVIGSHEIGFFERGDRTEIGLAGGAAFDNPYSLCAVDICPVGALTSVDFRFKKRAWMLESRATVCAGCARVCSVWLDSSDGVAYRMRPREDDEADSVWMCDEGRMTYKMIAPLSRLKSPVVFRDGEHFETDWSDAVRKACELISSSDEHGIACVLSARASMEENLALAKLCRESLGAETICFSKSPEDPSFVDSMLRLSDRDPNLCGVKLISQDGVDAIPKGSGVIALERPAPDDLISIIDNDPAWAVLLASSCENLGRWADVVFPKTTHFEQCGTFVGDSARKFERAIEPIFDARPVWEIAGLIARDLGSRWDLGSSGDCLSWGRSELDSLEKILSKGKPMKGADL